MTIEQWIETNKTKNVPLSEVTGSNKYVDNLRYLCDLPRDIAEQIEDILITAAQVRSREGTIEYISALDTIIHFIGPRETQWFANALYRNGMTKYISRRDMLYMIQLFPSIEEMAEAYRESTKNPEMLEGFNKWYNFVTTGEREYYDKSFISDRGHYLGINPYDDSEWPELLEALMRESKETTGKALYTLKLRKLLYSIAEADTLPADLIDLIMLENEPKALYEIAEELSNSLYTGFRDDK